VTTVLLVRHGLTHLTGPVLAGWTPDLHLDERGLRQAEDLGERLRTVPLTAIVSSPLDRCRETAAAILAGRDLELQIDDALGECHYGDWTGREIRGLARDPLWKVVQSHPSAVTFPNGEALRDVQSRAVDAIRSWNDRLGPGATWLAVSHADVIKAITADALGMHLDQFQRIGISPASLTIVRYTRVRPIVLRVNDLGADVTELLPPARRGRRRAMTA